MESSNPLYRLFRLTKMMVVVEVIIVAGIAVGWAAKLWSESEALSYAGQSSIFCAILLVLIWTVGFLSKTSSGDAPRDPPPP